MRHLLLCSLLIACKGATSSETDPTGEPPASPPGPCMAVISGSIPADAEMGVPIADPVQVQFDLAIDATDTWSLSINGVTGTSSLAGDGLSASFMPDVPLEYETTYAIEASVCEDGALTTFTTRERPLLDSDIEGKTYIIAFPNINFIAPPPVLINTVAANAADWILVQITDIDDTTRVLSANAGAANTGLVGPEVNCDFSFDAGVGDFSNPPGLGVGPTVFTIPLGATNIVIEDFVLGATVGANGDSLNDIHITGLLDTRAITGFGDVCLLAALAQVNCIPCLDGAPRCLNVNATAALAEYDPLLDIEGTCF